MLEINDLFRESDYLKLYPDVAAAISNDTISSGLDHFLKFGKQEGRNPSTLFNESYYQTLYPDVAAAIQNGTISSGLEHYLNFGQKEGRETCPVFSESLYRQANPDVVAAIDPLTGAITNCLDHFIHYGASEGRDAHARTAVVWDQAAQQAVINAKSGPTVSSRVYGMVHTAMFDAWSAYDLNAKGTQLGDTLQRPTEENTFFNKSEAMSYAAYRTLVDLFPNQVDLFNTVMNQLGYTVTNRSADVKTPSGIGVAAAKALINFRHNDGSNQLNGYVDTTGYQPVNTPDTVNDLDRWQPLRVPLDNPNGTVQKFATPQWSQVIPFGLTSSSEFRPPAPTATLGTPEYRQQAQEILDMSANLTDEQKVIAEYWEDGPTTSFPPGKWMKFGQFVSMRDAHTLDDDVKMFFVLGNAVMDAGIAAWDAKIAYDSVRPITAIRSLFDGQSVQAWGGPGQGTKTIDGGDWIPYQASNVVTPPFAEYVSGHSTFSAAAAEVLKQFTGSDAFGASYTQAAGKSRFEPGVTPASDVTLSWPTFSAAADQAGLSRRYGGIHFADGDLQGRALGRQVGQKVWNTAQFYIQGA